MADIKTAFITGAASGIGKALAEQLASEGVALYLTDINEEALSEVASALKASQVNVHHKKLDVASKEGVFAAVADAEQKIGALDAIFNNAGVSLTDTIDTMSYENFEWLMDINFWGVVHGTKAVLPKMLERGTGHIINISSIFGHVGIPGQSAYCAAKHAVKGFNESIHYDLKDTGVQIHSVHPGGVDTGIVRNGRQLHNKNGVVDPADMQKRFEEMAITTPKQAAKIILSGVRASKYRILVGRDAKFMDRFQRFFPNLWRKRVLKNTGEENAF
jgi:NADP-dependent 3-hydroxy acid dehydrogenase YdfG